MSFMMANIPENPDHINRQIDYILLTGMGPFLIFGDLVVKARLAHMDSMFGILRNSICDFFDPRNKSFSRKRLLN